MINFAAQLGKMAGIYLHIPFCRQACHYCDFHFSTSLKHKKDMIDALEKEITLRNGYLPEKKIESIYFGGGTPSILSADDVHRLLDKIYKDFHVEADAEITLEANPDDLVQKQLNALRRTPVNRLSIGIQSFFDEDLKWMNRAHNAVQADSAVKRSQDAGFEQITADLIYGYPLLTDAKWARNIRRITALDIPHISAYSMTVEADTALDVFIRKGRQQPMNEQQSAAQFLYLMQEMSAAGFEQYEISNFAKAGKYARHNSGYWRRATYLGIGPSAHSFDGTSRQWNISSNALYIRALQDGMLPFEREMLTPANHINEYLMTALRTMWGIDLAFFEKEFGSEAKNRLRAQAASAVQKGWINEKQGHISLTTEGKLFADKIAASLFT